EEVKEEGNGEDSEETNANPNTYFCPCAEAAGNIWDAVIVLDGDVEAGMDGARDEVALDDEVDDGTEVF
ncbi:hypothetical protein MMC31_001440, partial [Peltigera leucophlebia]|nr:hypothetical protein [Peltigera leucophlebia]